jgi:hypothetical protein
MATRKYTDDAIQAERARPKGRGGRPRKYASEEEKKAARAEAVRRHYWRKKNADCGVEVDGAIAAQRHERYETDEERAAARREQALRQYYEHKGACDLARASRRERKSDTA